MKNYISVNAKYYQLNEMFRIINHNLRIDKIDYLLDKDYRKYENKNIVFGLEQKYNNIDLNDSSNTKMKNMFFSNITKMCQQRDKQNQQKNYHSNLNKNDLVEMIFSLSEEQTLFYLNDDKKYLIDMAYQQLGMEIKNRYGFEPLMASMHYDEGHIKTSKKLKENIDYDVNHITNEMIEIQKKEKYNFHCQMTFFNYDFKNSRSVLRTMKKQDWRDIQDLAQNVFRAFGLDYKRGISKEITNKEHLDNLEYKNQQLEQQLLSMTFERDKLYEQNKDLSFVNDKLNNEIDLLNKDIIEKSDNINELMNIFEQLNDNIKNQKIEIDNKIKEINKLKNDIKDLYNSKETLKNENSIDSNTNEQLKNNIKNQKLELEKVIRIEQKLRKMSRDKKDFLNNYEKNIKNLQILEKDKTTNISQHIQKIKDICLKHNSLFSFDEKGYYEEMMNEYNDLLSVNYVNRSLKNENKDLKNEVKQLKSIDSFELQRQNKKLYKTIEEKEQTIKDLNVDIDFLNKKFEKVDIENDQLRNKVHHLENEKKKNISFIGEDD